MHNKELYTLLHDAVDGSWLMEKTEELWKIERGQCQRNYRESSRFVYDILKKSGLKNVARIPFPADGATVYQDKTMPLAWEASVGKLTVKKSPVAFHDPVVADISRHPFHLVKGSCSTAPGGVTARLISYEQMYLGADTRGAMVIIPPDTGPRERRRVYREICDFGAMGVVSDWLGTRYETPDALHWVNGCSEGPQWHIIRTDRPLVGFSVTPRIGDGLRNAVRRGSVILHVESDGRNFEDEIDVVTGVIPGRDGREVWVLSHLYEPLTSDNSGGAVCTLEICRKINQLVSSGRLPQPRFTIRPVFGLELYGFAAYAASRGGCMSGEVVGAINIDDAGAPGKGRIEARLAPPPSAFAGDHLAEELVKDCGDELDAEVWINESGGYGDDTFLNDPTTGIPTIWYHPAQEMWHNSMQTMDIIDEDFFRSYAAFAGSWICRMSGPLSSADVGKCYRKARKRVELEFDRITEAMSAGGEVGEERGKPEAWMAWRFERERQILEDLGDLAGDGARQCAEESVRDLEQFYRRKALEIERKAGAASEGKTSRNGKFREIAASMVSERATVGMPHDLSKAPAAVRRHEDAIHHRILANMDGEKTLAELIGRNEWETSLASSALRAGQRNVFSPLSEAAAKRYVSAVEYLTSHGYLRTRYDATVKKEDILSALEKAGLGRGDAVMVHCALSPFGHIEGGAETVVDAFLETVGEEGTIIMPAFTFSTIYIEGMGPVVTKRRFFDKGDTGQLRVGRVAKAFLERPGVKRSAHPSHSFAVAGKHAEQWAGAHRETDAPCGRTTPLAKLPGHDGKIVWFGAELATTTFFHFLENEKDMPYLKTAICFARNAGGRTRIVTVPRSVPGHRDFYCDDAEENSRIYRKLIADGLEIRRVPLGFGEVKAISAGQMHSLGIAALEDDPSVLLCDNRDCLFCVDARGQLNGPRKNGLRAYRG